MTVSVITGDCLDVLPTLSPKSVNMICTSPPYWGLRDYGNELQLGLEKTPDEYVANMVYAFRVARNVLRDDGTLWLNLGDSYASDAKGDKRTDAQERPRNPDGFHSGSGQRWNTGRTWKVDHGLKPKDLVGIPWRVALALQADGWYLRSDIIWSKPNPMPESVTDRPTKAHEYIFLLSKSERYYYDAAAIAEPMTTDDVRRPRGSIGANSLDPRGENAQGRGMPRTAIKPYTGKATKDYAAGGAQDPSATKARITDAIIAGDITTRNKRSVWTVTTKPYSGAHFATFPPDLIEPCILAGCPVGGTVLDPFGGAGTTGLVADRLQRNAILIELNPAYADMARDRIRQDAGMFADVTA